MTMIGFLWMPAYVRPPTPLFLFRWFWMLRASAMLCALISIFLLCSKRLTHWPWFVKLNLLINIPGLAACTFGILQYVIVNLPSPS
jgi:hypothetical protein